MREEGVRLDRNLPGTVLSVSEALALAFGEIGDPLVDGEVERLVGRINAENDRRETAREEWEQAPVETMGITLTPGEWYAVTERIASYGSGTGGKTRTFRFSRYLGRRGFGGDPDRVVYRFEKWSQAAAKKFDRYARGVGETYGERGIEAIEVSSATEALRQTIEYQSLPIDAGLRKEFLARVTG